MPNNTDATIAAPSAAAGAGAGDGPVWTVIEGKGVHVTKSTTKDGTATTRCGLKGNVEDVVGTIPAGRRPPCEKCASK